MANEQFFTKALTKWGEQVNNRKMPWKGEKDPYKIWLSEIILQQTRVEQGTSYYQKFINKYKSICYLANASDEAVFKLWEGLGYYNRCRNLLATARFVCYERSGVFPTSYDEIISLKGIGPYTAAAIASFAFGLPYAVVDGNVLRVLARFFGLTMPIDAPIAKAHYNELANRLLYKKDAALYNQSIMDFGATVCTPTKPLCLECPLVGKCVAFKENMVEQLPVKSKRQSKKQRFFVYLILEYKGKWFIRQRSSGDIWRGLHEFFLVETQEQNDHLWKQKQIELGLSGSKIKTVTAPVIQLLTHQRLSSRFVHIQCARKPTLPQGFFTVNLCELNKYAFPKTIKHFLNMYLPNNL